MSQKKRFLFLCLKYAACSFIFWLVSGKIGLFPVLFHRKKVVCQFAASYFDFAGPLIKSNRKTCFGLLATKLEVSKFMSEKAAI